MSETLETPAPVPLEDSSAMAPYAPGFHVPFWYWVWPSNLMKGDVPDEVLTEGGAVRLAAESPRAAGLAWIRTHATAELVRLAARGPLNCLFVRGLPHRVVDGVETSVPDTAAEPGEHRTEALELDTELSIIVSVREAHTPPVSGPFSPGALQAASERNQAGQRRLSEARAVERAHRSETGTRADAAADAPVDAAVDAPA